MVLDTASTEEPLGRIAGFALAVGAARDVPSVCRALARALAADPGIAALRLELANGGGCTFALVGGEEPTALDAEAVPPAERDRALAENAPVAVGDRGVVLPLVANGEPLGVLHVEASRKLDRPHLRFLAPASQLAALAIANVRAREDLELRVAERTRRLNELNRELESFTYTVAHDLRAPLRAVEFLSSMMLRDYEADLDDDGKMSLRSMHASSERMSQLVEGLLALARSTQGDIVRERVDLTALAASVADDLRAEQPARSVEVAIEPDLAAKGDPRLLRVLLSNLLGNAWKFTKDAPAAKIEVGRSDGAFFVRDNGIGFDAAKADRLFGPFQRMPGSEGFEGTGIGLATVRRVVQRHGGRVWAESKRGEGATIWFSLADA